MAVRIPLRTMPIPRLGYLPYAVAASVMGEPILRDLAAHTSTGRSFPPTLMRIFTVEFVGHEAERTDASGGLGGSALSLPERKIQSATPVAMPRKRSDCLHCRQSSMLFQIYTCSSPQSQTM